MLCLLLLFVCLFGVVVFGVFWFLLLFLFGGWGGGGEWGLLDSVKFFFVCFLVIAWICLEFCFVLFSF